MSNEAHDVEQMSFREVMSELDAIVAALEGNQLELEESLKLYERGVELLRVSKMRLDEAQQKVTVLLGTLDVDTDDSVDTKLS